MKILYFHSIMLTIFHANSAANASCGTGFHSDRSLVGRTAGYLHRIGIWDQTDQVFRTYLYTFSAGLTLLFVYYGYTVFDVNGIERTYLCAGSISKAAAVTGFRSASGDKAHHTAILDSVIIIVCLRPVAITLAVNIRYFSLGSLCLYSHDRSDFFADFLSAYRTGINGSLSFCNRSGKSGTSGEPTAATVITGKGGKYRFFLLIYFYFEFYTGHAKKQSHKDADDSDTSRSNQNSCYTHLCYSFLDQTGESAESNCHQSRCQQHHGHSLERFRHLIVFHFFTQSSQDHDGNGKTKGCGKSVYNTGQNTVFLLYIGNRYT